MTEKDDEKVDIPVSNELFETLQAEAKKRNVTIEAFVEALIGELVGKDATHA